MTEPFQCNSIYKFQQGTENSNESYLEETKAVKYYVESTSS